MADDNYWTLAQEYFFLVEAACEELVKIKKGLRVIGDEAIIQKQDDMARWSDHKVGIPTLINFFYGIELILKGFIAFNPDGKVNNDHKLTDLLEEFNKVYPHTGLDTLIAEYTRELDPQSPLGRLLAANQITINDWYQALQYPESTTPKPFNLAELKYTGINTVAFWQDIGESAQKIRVATVALVESLEDSSQPPITP